jgi:hypothetical protein
MSSSAEALSGLPYETGLTLADYEIIVDVENQLATNRDKAKEEGEQLRHLLGDRFEIRHVLTDPDKLETALIIEEAMGDEADKCVVFVRTGDGGNGGPTRAAIGRGAALWKANAGLADNLGRASFPRRHRSNPETIIERSRIVRTRPLYTKVLTADGGTIYRGYFADEFGIGHMADAQIEREKPEHREHLSKLGAVRARLLDAKVGKAAMDAAPHFKARVEVRNINKNHDGAVTEEDGEVLDEQIGEFDELFWTNIGKIALYGRIRDSHMTDPKMVQISKRYRTKLGPIGYHLRLFTVGVSGEDIPDGQLVKVEMLTDANAQGSGDPFTIAKGSIVKVRRSTRDLFVVTTKKRP